MNTSNSNQGSMSAEARLRRTLDKRLLASVFQPIVDMRSGEVAGHEVLTRPLPDSGFQNADELFSAAETTGMNWEVEAVARQMAMQAAGNWRPGTLLFLNSSPEVIAHPRFAPQILNDLRAVGKLTPTRIVLEITERCRDREFETLPDSIDMLRETGFQIAIDDVGAGTSGLNRIMTLRPGWLKLDRELVDGIDQDKIRQHMVRFLVYFGRLSAIRVIGEGIERREELDTLIELGVGYGQGYLLGRPGEPVERISPELARHIRSRASKSIHVQDQVPERERARVLARHAPVTEATARVCEVATMLLHDLDHPGCIVVDGGCFVGWCDRDAVLRAASDGRASLAVSYLVGSNRAAVEASTPLADALDLAASRTENRVGSPLVVLDDDRVVGIIPISDLLKAASEACRSSQSRATSIAGVPGRVRTDLHLREMLESTLPDRHHDITFVDLRSFAEYNHRFGYELGDQLIQQLVGQIRSVLLRNIDEAFLGHVRDDQFIISSPHGMLDANLGAFLARFEERADLSTVRGEAGSEFPRIGVRIMILERAVPACRATQEIYRARGLMRLMLDRAPTGLQSRGPSQVVRFDAAALTAQPEFRQASA
ncbi:MAG: EAL domain-containing protein [Leptolyngbya sp. PLA3]|nr:MAG: EAL domain-containing protein [Cyanobacteria bacterium CYA]MCE7968190.1 EAL domain-containing protein [Leptolyngbya sp. PL-A3]